MSHSDFPARSQSRRERSGKCNVVYAESAAHIHIGREAKKWMMRMVATDLPRTFVSHIDVTGLSRAQSTAR